MTREAFAATNYIIEYKNKDGSRIANLTNLKLQKLLYFAYGIHLSLFNEKLFDDDIQAWQFGPVVKTVYDEFKDHVYNPIGLDCRATIPKQDNPEEYYPPEISEFTEAKKVKSLLIACILHGNKSAWALVDMLHDGEKSAWKKHYNKDKRGIIIPDEDILSEFEGSIDEIATFVIG